MTNAEVVQSAGDESLIRQTQTLKTQYEALAKLIEALRDETSRDVGPMNEQMQLIKQTEETLKPMREAHLAAGHAVEGTLKEINDATIEIVISLMPMLADLEKSSVDSLRRLFPRIQGSVRAIQMQNAYEHHQQ